MAMPRRRRSFRPTNWIGPIVISGIVGAVAWTISDQPSAINLFARDPVGVATSTEPDLVTASTTIIKLGIPQPKADRDQLMALEVETGLLKEEMVEKGWRVASKKVGNLKIESSESRGFRLTDGDEWNVPLRSSGGETYSEPIYLGMFNELQAAVYARGTKRSILRVDRAGGTQILGTIPENAEVIGFSGYAVWYSTFTPGEGIESEPSGPSDLWRINYAGKAEKIASSTSVIESILVNAPNPTYWSDGSFFTIIDGKTSALHGVPKSAVVVE